MGLKPSLGEIGISQRPDVQGRISAHLKILEPPRHGALHPMRKTVSEQQ